MLNLRRASLPTVEFNVRRAGIAEQVLITDLKQRIERTSNNSQFLTPAPYPVRGKLQRESSYVKSLWIPAFAGMTFLEVAYSVDSKIRRHSKPAKENV